MHQVVILDLELYPAFVLVSIDKLGPSTSMGPSGRHRDERGGHLELCLYWSQAKLDCNNGDRPS